MEGTSGVAPRTLLAIFLLTAGLLPAAFAADDNRETPLVRAVRQSQQAVVNIHTEKEAPEDRDARLFSPKSRRVNGMGTGIVVDASGLIVTNFHVIQDVDLITVTLRHGGSFDAQVISYDRRLDLAIIRIDSPEPLAVMPIGTSSDLMLGETVYAVGNAFGYENTITSGIISALHRDVEVDETQSYQNLIQTDASINPGNSGGPLLNLNGEVIGINVAIRSGAQRIGFAIPIDDARKTIARLLSVERLNGHSHGLITSDVKSPEHRKLVVEDVAPGSPAAACGICKGDVISSIRGIPVIDGADLERALLDLPPRLPVEVRLLRDNTSVVVQYSRSEDTTTVAATDPTGNSSSSQTVMRPASNSFPTTNQPADASKQLPDLQTTSPRAPENKAWEVLGLRVETLSASDVKLVTGRPWPGGRGPVRYNGGLKVTEVREGSPAAALLKKSDILLGLDGYETTSLENLTAILDRAGIQSPPQSQSQPPRRLKCQYLPSGMNPLEGTLQLPQ
jgi:serine protease Do